MAAVVAAVSEYKGGKRATSGPYASSSQDCLERGPDEEELLRQIKLTDLHVAYIVGEVRSCLALELSWVGMGLGATAVSA